MCRLKEVLTLCRFVTMYVRCCYSVAKPFSINRADFVSYESLSYSSCELCKKILILLPSASITP